MIGGDETTCARGDETIVFGFCDSSICGNAWRCRKHGPQVRQGDLAARDSAGIHSAFECSVESAPWANSMMIFVF